MRTDGNTINSLKKLAHIGVIAVVMVLTMGVAAVVSGHPADVSVTRTHSVRQSPLPVQAPVEQVAQPELMHDTPAVELTDNKPVSHRRIMKMVVTAYCPCAKCCGENAAGITASGKRVSYNGGRFVAADASLAFGTKLLIPGYANGSVEVLDRGGAIRGNRIDVFFPTHQQALQWGRQTLEVTVVD
jgi:3D (Asp-Asp-Asp) domain-containing protein